MPRYAARPTASRWPAVAGAAALLAGCALVVRHQVRKAEAANPPRGRFVEVEGGLKVHFIERGDADAPVLVMLHGNGAMAEELVHSGLVSRASMRYRVLAFDRPGYGHSDAPPPGMRNPFGQARLIEQALDRLGVREALVFGHSWGTLVALALALQAPRRVRALVLAAGYYRAGPRADVAWLSAPALPGLGTLMRHTVSPLLSRLLWPAFCWRMFSPREVTEPFRSQYPVWMSLRPKQLLASAAESALMIPSALKLQRRYGELRMPLVIVGGDTDRMLRTGRHGEFLHEAVPGSRLHVLPGAGHMVHHVATHSVMKAIDEAAVAAGHVTPQQRARASREAPTLPAG